jgi:DNA-binding NtrC family response regulator
MAQSLHKTNRPPSGVAAAKPPELPITRELTPPGGRERTTGQDAPGKKGMNLQRLSLLVVEDEQSLARLWAGELERLVEATLAHTLQEARSKLRGRAYDVMLLDLQLPDGDGLELLKEVATRGDDTSVIILTGNAGLDSAIQALRFGAYDYLTKPCRLVELEQVLERLALQQALRNENQALRQQITATQRKAPALIGSGEALARVRTLIERVAPTNASVLITGETGTGKEVAARMVHARSSRRDNAFVPVNCAALPRELAESELFGHRKGAFTGADRDHRGLVAAAAGGTLFLDEIGDLPLEMQAKFLRLLESAEARRIGDTEPYRTDVRIVAATNRDLRKDVAAGRFRQDLFYRLATFELALPALREILDDLPAIADHLLDSIVVPTATAVRFSPQAIAAMKRYPWPGNVRELRNVVERAKILCDQQEVLAEHVNLPVTPKEDGAAGVAPTGTIAEVEWVMIETALRQHGGNKTAAAKSLGISLRTLYNKLDARAEGRGDRRSEPSAFDPRDANAS